MKWFNFFVQYSIFWDAMWGFDKPGISLWTMFYLFVEREVTLSKCVKQLIIWLGSAPLFIPERKAAISLGQTHPHLTYQYLAAVSHHNSGRTDFTILNHNHAGGRVLRKYARTRQCCFLE